MDSIYLAATAYLDKDHPDIQEFALAAIAGKTSQKEQAIALFYAVRDGFQYSPNRININKSEIKSSLLLQRKKGHCIDKACFLATCARAVGIPSRLGFGCVKNHIATEKVAQILRTNIMAFHGYTELWIDGKWVKATPAFNKELCNKLNVATLEFDGETDCMFQQFDRNGSKYMEYTEDFGQFPDLPYDLMLETFARYYPHLKDYEVDGVLRLDMVVK